MCNIVAKILHILMAYWLKHLSTKHQFRNLYSFAIDR